MVWDLECAGFSWQRKCMYSPQESLLCSFTGHSFLTAFSPLCRVFFYSQDPAWNRPTFSFLHTYFVGQSSSTEWSITKVSVEKHSGTPVFKVSLLVQCCSGQILLKVECISHSSGRRRTRLPLWNNSAYICLHSWHSWHNCPSDLSLNYYLRHVSV